MKNLEGREREREIESDAGGVTWERGRERKEERGGIEREREGWSWSGREMEEITKT